MLLDEILAEAQFQGVCGFVRTVGRSLGKRVDVTGENVSSTAFMRHVPATDELVRVPPEPPVPLLGRLRGDG